MIILLSFYNDFNFTENNKLLVQQIHPEEFQTQPEAQGRHCHPELQVVQGL